MTQFPVQRTRARLGTGGTPALRLDVRTGGRERAEALQRIAGAVQAWTNVLKSREDESYRMEAETEFSDAKLATREDYNRTAIQLNENLDPSTYHRKKDEFITRSQSRPFRTRLAAEKYHLWVDSRIPTWDNTFEEARQGRVKDNRQAQLFALTEEAIRTGHVVPVVEYIDVEVKAGRMKEADAVKLIADTRHKAEVRAALQFAQANPEAALESIEGDKMDGFVLLEPDDIARVGNMAVNARYRRDNKLDSAKMAAQEEIWDRARKNELDGIAEFIDGISVFTPAEKQAELSKAMSVARLVQQGKGNPYVIRQNHEKYWQMFQDAADKKLTEKQIRKEVGKSITINDGKELLNLGTGKGSHIAAGVKKANDVMDNMLETYQPTTQMDAGEREEKILFASKKAKWLLEDLMKTSEKPLSAREIEEESLRIGLMIKKELETQTRAEMTAARDIGIELEKIDLSKIPKTTPTGPVRITTKAQFDALTSGTEFIAPNGELRRKK